MQSVGRTIFIAAPKYKTPHFSIPRWSFSVEFGITGRYNLGRIRHAQRPPTCPVVSTADFHFFLHYVITIHQRYSRTYTV